MTPRQRLAHRATLACHFSLLGLMLAWMILLSPSQLPLWLVLLFLVTPLLIPLRGLLQGRAMSHFWISLIALLYLLHGAVELFSSPQDRRLAMAEILLALCLFVVALAYVRLMGGVIPRRPRHPEP